jgi:hypothetical protein
MELPRAVVLYVGPDNNRYGFAAIRTRFDTVCDQSVIGAELGTTGRWNKM